MRKSSVVSLFLGILILCVIGCDPDGFSNDLVDTAPKLMVEGYLDASLGAQLVVTSSQLLGNGDIPYDVPWVADADIDIFDASGFKGKLFWDTLGFYSNPLLEFEVGEEYSIDISKATFASVSIQLDEIPPAPDVRRGAVVYEAYIPEDENSLCSICPDEYVAEVEVSSPAGFAIALGDLTRSDDPYAYPPLTGFFISSFYGMGMLDDGAVLGCESVSTMPIVSSGCEPARISQWIRGTLSWPTTLDTTSSTLSCRVAALSVGYIPYLNAHQANTEDWGITGQLLYSEQRDVPSNVVNGYGFVVAQHTSSFEVEKP